MAKIDEVSEARENVLRVAEKLFSERGYTAVTLRDIADTLGVRQPALYYHVPEGKEQLFVEVMTRNFNRHKAGLTQAIADAETNIAAQLKALAFWLLTQPPINIARLARSDMPALTPKNANTLYELGDMSLTQPIRRVLEDAYRRGETRLVDTQIMATVFLATVDTMHEMHTYKGTAKEVLVQDVIEVLLDGMRRH